MRLSDSLTHDFWPHHGISSLHVLANFVLELTWPMQHACVDLCLLKERLPSLTKQDYCRFTILTSFAQEDAIRKSAFGLNFIALTVSSGGAWTSKSFMGLSWVPSPRVLVVVEVEPNVPKPEVPLKPVPVEPNMSVNYWCTVFESCILISKEQ